MLTTCGKCSPPVVSTLRVGRPSTPYTTPKFIIGCQWNQFDRSSPGCSCTSHSSFERRAFAFARFGGRCSMPVNNPTAAVITSSFSSSLLSSHCYPAAIPSEEPSVSPTLPSNFGLFAFARFGRRCLTSVITPNSCLYTRFMMGKVRTPSDHL